MQRKQTQNAQAAPVLEISHLSISFRQYDRGTKQTTLSTIRDLSVAVRAGELVAVVGSSGSGKSLLAHAVLGILPYNAEMGGEILYQGKPLDKKRVEKLRGREIVLIPQSTSYLDPLMKIGRQIVPDKSDKGKIEKRKGIFKRYHLEEKTAELYPFELSGGMTRRILISTALVEEPKLVIADEPTPGLDLTTARRAMEHFRECADNGAGVLLITHDLELAMETADRIVVFYAGTTIEKTAAGAFRDGKSLSHPYSRALWRALPQNGFSSIPGTQPYVKDLPEGCPFGPRCERFGKGCGGEIPKTPTKTGWVKCIYPCEEDAAGHDETGGNNR